MDEERIDSFRSSTERWLFGSFEGWMWVGILLLGPILALIFDSPWFMLVSAVSFVRIVVQWLHYMAAKYEITSQRLIIHRGIVFKSIDEVELYRVKDVKVNYSLLNQLFNIGTITVISSDRTNVGVPMLLPNVVGARDRREQLRGLVQSERVRRGVREIDYEPAAVEPHA